MTRVKICGITGTSQALAAAEAGADYLGLVFAPGGRQLNPQKAGEIVRQVQALKSPPLMVGVFVNSPVEEVNILAESCRLDCVQLSGDESWEYCLQIKKPLLRAIHIAGDSTLRDIIEEVEKGHRMFAGADLICLLDTQVKNAYGGTGQKFDWQLAREVCARFPVMIAGGLTPENLAQLIAEVHPWGVDVSSGVETGGQKDIYKIQNFISIAKVCTFPSDAGTRGVPSQYRGGIDFDLK